MTANFRIEDFLQPGVNPVWKLHYRCKNL